MGLIDQLREHYGRCDRDNPPARNDCYWGADERGHRNGCLFVSWRGRACPHWHPDEQQCADIMKHYGEVK